MILQAVFHVSCNIDDLLHFTGYSNTDQHKLA